MLGSKVTRLSAAGVVMFAVVLPSSTQADSYHFKDALRPHGHARTLSTKLADANSCGASGTHISGDVTAFKRCMRGRGWVVDRYTPDPKPPVGATDDSTTYIDPDTGLSCRNFGGIAVCDTPHGTVHYQSREGLNCTRSGIVNICSSFQAQRSKAR
jgi:hypothetical protein